MRLMKTNVDRIISTDVLVIGGGGAAVRAAVAAFDAGAKTMVVLKGQRGRSGATVSPDSAGVAWQLADECSGTQDSPEAHYRNIMEVGLGMVDPRLARILAYEIVERSAELERWGLQFAPDPAGKKPHYTGYSCFGDQPRAHCILNSGRGHAGDVVHVLVEQIRSRQVDIHENIFITDLLVQEHTCVGALALGPEGEILAYHAGAVILGSGGARQIFPQEPERTPIDTTGDGYAMALRAGAELTNMEFIQLMLHPVPPFPVKVPGVYWALLPRLKNRHGKDALAPYLPAGLSQEEVLTARTLHYPFSSRDSSKWVDIAFASEIRAGRGTPAPGLYLDFSQVDLRHFKPSRLQHIPEDPARPVELPAGPVQVRLAAHAINGGLRTDETAETTLKGLFAIGEAATGSHGADRLGGGMVSGSQVFAARAGKYAAERARSARSKTLAPETLAPAFERLQRFGRGEREANQVLAALQEATGTHLVVLRNEAGLAALLARIKELEEEWLPQVAVGTTPELRRAIEVDNSLLTAELMTRAALLRRESRGSHYREDFPTLDEDHWRKNILFHMDGPGRLQVGTESLEQSSAG
jgi:fumarate reductase (CoM/CoB) subunit A